MNRIIALLCLFCTISLFAPSPAAAAQIGPGAFSASAPLINFDNLTGGSSISTGDIITNQYAPLGIVFNDPDYPMRANASPIGDGTISDSKPNVAFVQQHDGVDGRPLELLFSTPVTMVGTKFFTSLSSTITLSTFDSANHLLESLTLTGTDLGSGRFLEGFIGLQETTPIAMAQLSSASIGGSVFNFDIDDVRFQAVPEPSTILLLGIGLLVLSARLFCGAPSTLVPSPEVLAAGSG